MDGEAMQFAGSLLAVALLVALTYFLGFRQPGTLDSESEAKALFQLAPGGFEPAELALDTSGAAAIARDAEGRIAVLVPHGNQFVVRPLHSDIVITAHDGKLRIPGMESVHLELGERAGDWAAADSDANKA